MAEIGHILIVANPTAGCGKGERLSGAVADALQKDKIRVRVQFTSSTGEAERLTACACQEVDPPDCIVACGGDGTIQEVANALAKHKANPREGSSDGCPALGIAPAGRCNDFARVLGIHDDVEAIYQTLRFGNPQSIDLGKVNDRYFCTVATLGVDAEVSSFVDAMRMPLTGTLAYVYGAVRVLLRYRAKRVRLIGDFGTIDQLIFLASCANTASYGGAIKIVPQADPTDGKLDLCIIDSVSRLRSLSLLPAMLMGRHVKLSVTRFIRTTGYRIETDEPAQIWADGERIAQTPATVEIAPGAVNVMMPS